MAGGPVKMIVCLGNRLFDQDAAGPLVYDRLVADEAARDIELLEGGTAGLNLLPLLRGRKRIVFVDAVAGLGEPGEVAAWSAEQLRALPLEPHYGHEAGLLYLLHALPATTPEAPTAIFLVGLEGVPTAQAITQAARLALDLAHDQDDRGSLSCFTTGERHGNATTHAG
ncbi:MAG: hydrogenase maturation protease [Thermodesulfobacteriota bacterium]